MKPLYMHRVKRILHDLQPIARDHRRADIAQHAIAHEQIPARHQGRWLRSQVGKD